jgi:hypothetical protein
MRLRWGRRRPAVERMVALIVPPERRQVGICGSCGGPVVLDPAASHAVCACGDCRIPRAFMRYGDQA